MTGLDRNWMEMEIRNQLRCAVTNEYDSRILNHEISFKDSCVKVTVMDMIIAEIVETSDYESEGCFSASDVRYAIGRTFCELLGIEY